ncbi:MAG: hypothetical protein MMC33_007360 [Icmadophila ericetorum]|nr:hypothetical protein [Icmadophila ericetorum]
MEASMEARHAVPPYEAWPTVPKGQLGSPLQRDVSHVMETDSASMRSESRSGRATSELSMDDIEAAHALEGLRADFVKSPRRQVDILPSKTEPALRSPTESQQPEPLLSLLTSQHPLLQTAINGSLSAYSSSKEYSPRFRYGAEFVERHIGTPVASTVGTAGRISGVETGVRWWLQRTDSNGMQDGSNKRQRTHENETHEKDVERGMRDVSLQSRQRRVSDLSFAESLPPYDDQRSPRYEEHDAQVQPSHHEMRSPTWQARLMMSTSGLGVAMSDESLRSLKYCLSWLRWANGHLGKVLSSLQQVLEEWNQSQQQQDTDMANGGSSRPPARDEAAITRHIQALKSDVLKTLKDMVDTVSKYAGGALPDNAKVLVRRHLTSLPQRFLLASSSNAPSSNNDSEKQSSTPEPVSTAHKVIVLAKEGLDMMGQVSGVLNGTIVSAEEWCDRLGRRRETQSNNAVTAPEHDNEKRELAQREHMNGHQDEQQDVAMTD